MSADDDFASLMRGDSGQQGFRRFRKGETLDGEIVAIAQDEVFVDVGGNSDARIDRAELIDETGALRVRVGDKVRGVLVEASGADGLRLSVSVGRAGADARALRTAFESNLAVEGTVRSVNKGGLEIDIGGTRAFCPASQVEIGRVEDLSVYVGQTLRFKITEWRGSSPVVSRRQLLEDERQFEAARLLESVKVGDDLDGVVRSVQRYGAFIDIGGLEGLLHISELGHHRVSRVEDVVGVGDRVRVRVVAIETSESGPRLGLSMKALEPVEQREGPGVDEVLDASVVELSANGVVVETTKGQGFVRTRDLDLTPGSDPRRAYPVGTKLRVTLVATDPRTGRRTFSMKRVAAVEERRNFAEYENRTTSSATVPSNMGTFGALLAKKLGIPSEAPLRPDVPSSMQPESDRNEQPRPEPVRADPPGMRRRKRR